eukprot:CAMPEP_0113311016 /NCGR_PEP_ID=MMETSP0010_2-20120614/8429_1 /TAXON_ID=216773 ORGANISM="Corethron hystrix, Strain 308" /NCGR_SAMPLE_ID=MMETSP0010_2 /ASSEMBLY_ACC=CAM_ASM_000155 /LENGTH=433 /DNA_ID=CAMNT_0000166585 /DNA_START=100 /DNA_END=1401 /DNA_ORIENTATION=+ /assembly_acc=CAM_ASM_000155
MEFVRSPRLSLSSALTSAFLLSASSFAPSSPPRPLVPLPPFRHAFVVNPRPRPNPLFSGSPDDLPSFGDLPGLPKIVDPADRPSLSVDTGGKLAFKQTEEDEEALPINYRRPEVWRDADPLKFPREGVKLITFDAVGTLIRMTTSVGMFYREALNQAFGYVRLPRPDLFTAAFREAHRQQNAAYPCYGKNDGMTGEEWWRTVVRDTYRNMYDLFDDADLVEELESEDGEVFEAVFQQLYNEDFTGEEAWELLPDAYRTLRRLALWREQGGPRIGIVSNSDARLSRILYALGIEEYFDFVLTAEGTGSAKPDGDMFRIALREAQVEDPRLAAHVGNDFGKDCRCAAEAGWHGIWMHEDKFDLPEDVPDALDFSTAGDLVGVLAMYGVAPETREILTTRDIYEDGNYGFHWKVWDDHAYQLEGRDFREWSTNTME